MLVSILFTSSFPFFQGKGHFLEPIPVEKPTRFYAIVDLKKERPRVLHSSAEGFPLWGTVLLASGHSWAVGTQGALHRPPGHCAWEGGVPCTIPPLRRFLAPFQALSRASPAPTTCPHVRAVPLSWCQTAWSPGYFTVTSFVWFTFKWPSTSTKKGLFSYFEMKKTVKLLCLLFLFWGVPDHLFLLVESILML